ncbi:MAG TPA: hypothetical protein VFZ02_00450 [Ktedonobacteraceae bacterium]
MPVPQVLFLRLAGDRQTPAQSLLRLHCPRASALWRVETRIPLALPHHSPSSQSEM